MEKELQTCDPPFVMMPLVSQILSIAKAHPSFENWMLSNFIQTFHKTNSDPSAKSLIRFHDDVTIQQYCPLISTETMSLGLFKKWFNQCISEKLIDLLSSDKYIFTMLDSYHLQPHRKYYLKEHRPHMTMIYGFNNRKKVFYIMDFFGGRFGKNEVSFNDLTEGIIAIEDINFNQDFVKIHFTNIHYKSNYNFDIKHVFGLIHDYCNSNDTMYKQQSTRLNETKSRVYGLDTYTLLDEQLTSANPEIDVRSFQLLYIHKKLMIDRIQFILKYTGIPIEEEIVRNYNILFRKSLHLRNIVLKHSLNKENKSLNTIHNLLNDVCILDKMTSNKLLNQLEAWT